MIALKYKYTDTQGFASSTKEVTEGHDNVENERKANKYNCETENNRSSDTSFIKDNVAYGIVPKNDNFNYETESNRSSDTSVIKDNVVDGMVPRNGPIPNMTGKRTHEEDAIIEAEKKRTKKEFNRRLMKTHHNCTYLVSLVEEIKQEIRKLSSVREGIINNLKGLNDETLNQATMNRHNTLWFKTLNKNCVFPSRKIHNSIVMVVISNEPSHIGKTSAIFHTRNSTTRQLYIDGETVWYEDSSLLDVPNNLPICDRPMFQYRLDDIVKIVRTSNKHHHMKYATVVAIDKPRLVCQVQFDNQTCWYHQDFLELRDPDDFRQPDNNDTY